MPIFCDKPRTSIRKTGFRNWKKMVTDVKSLTILILIKHLLCDWQRECSGHGTILDQINPETLHSYFVERNRGVLKTVLDLVLFCAKQDIPLRGHRENSESLNQGSFLELLKVIFNYSPEQKKSSKNYLRILK
ncbi:Zinc finger MYM-type protein 1 [Holothuria leucospilota]|uniref:Zinc finger MYM-type protein 1 n=1 Tax=Holothuria leucospilota TaxID=206669 RepID=A0A9Q1H9R1_HOLLE|nr:Zinc finger MYM-type protein 1 [Holothuria leucospilota]